MTLTRGMLAALLLLGAAVSAWAAPDYPLVHLNVCNKGTIPVEVVTAEKNEPVLGIGNLFWDILGKTLAAGTCAHVYGSTQGHPAYIAFGITDAKGQWESGEVAHVPNFGTYAQWFQTRKILTGATQVVCVRQDQTHYIANGDIWTDCPRLQLTGNQPEVGHGAFVPVTAALYLETVNQVCAVGGMPNVCDYYLNIWPSASDRDLHAAMGTASGQNAETPEDNSKAVANFLQALARAGAEQREREARAAADAAEAQQRHLVEAAADREKREKQTLAAAAAGNPDAKVEAQMIGREAENNRQRWAGARQSPGAFDPQWQGQNVAVTGTVSRVEIDPSGSPQWVSIYFRESPDATFVVCSPYADLFQERIGPNLAALVGKTLEAAGQVESPHCGQKTSKGSIRVVESKQWQVH